MCCVSCQSTAQFCYLFYPFHCAAEIFVSFCILPSSGLWCERKQASFLLADFRQNRLLFLVFSVGFWTLLSTSPFSNMDFLFQGHGAETFSFLFGVSLPHHQQESTLMFIQNPPLTSWLIRTQSWKCPSKALALHGSVYGSERFCCGAGIIGLNSR